MSKCVVIVGTDIDTPDGNICLWNDSEDCARLDIRRMAELKEKLTSLVIRPLKDVQGKPIQKPRYSESLGVFLASTSCNLYKGLSEALKGGIVRVYEGDKLPALKTAIESTSASAGRENRVVIAMIYEVEKYNVQRLSEELKPASCDRIPVVEVNSQSRLNLHNQRTLYPNNRRLSKNAGRVPRKMCYKKGKQKNYR